MTAIVVGYKEKMMNMEQEILNAFERGKAFGFAEGMKSMQAEIEALKAENRVLRKGELWLGMVYNNRGMGIAPMYLENFMSFCEANGFTEESGYKLFKEQEK